jgi:hypothetical protein
MSAAFQYNLKRRPFFSPCSLLVTESEPKTQNKRLKGDTFRDAPGAPLASVQGLLSYLSPVVSLHTLNTTRRMCEFECVAQLRFSHDITGAQTTSEPVISPTYQRLLKP